ncbi:MAG: GlsB/YeaQ/YmgE family stress response membrane protein [Egibacteraceae bacterium]
MEILGFLILGLLAGAIAKVLLPGDDPGGLFITMAIGVVGALLGGYLARILLDANPTGGFFELRTWITAIVGSMILLLVYRLVARRRA